jgi:hypothetical protein
MEKKPGFRPAFFGGDKTERVATEEHCLPCEAVARKAANNRCFFFYALCRAD